MGFLLIAWVAFLVIVALILRFVPEDNLVVSGGGGFVPNRGDLIAFGAPVAAAGTVALLFVALVGDWILAGRMLRPLENISAAVRETASGSLTHRIDMNGPDDEFRRAADAFDGMLGRLEQAFDEQRRFTANASHELRTPFAATKTMLEVARAQGSDVDLATLLERLQAMNDRSIATVEALLRLARADQMSAAGENNDLADIVQVSLDAVEDERSRAEFTLVREVETAPVVGDSTLLAHLITNLVLNALRHDMAVGGHVWVRCGHDGSGSSFLEVENTGAVLDGSVIGALTEPFVRGVGRVRSAAGPRGSGLGLSIVSSIARRHQAALTLRSRRDGGLIVTVRFPRNPDR